MTPDILDQETEERLLARIDREVFNDRSPQYINYADVVKLVWNELQTLYEKGTYKTWPDQDFASYCNNVIYDDRFDEQIQIHIFDKHIIDALAGLYASTGGFTLLIDSFDDFKFGWLDEARRLNERLKKTPDSSGPIQIIRRPVEGFEIEHEVSNLLAASYDKTPKRIGDEPNYIAEHFTEELTDFMRQKANAIQNNGILPLVITLRDEAMATWQPIVDQINQECKQGNPDAPNVLETAPKILQLDYSEIINTVRDALVVAHAHYVSYGLEMSTAEFINARFDDFIARYFKNLAERMIMTQQTAEVMMPSGAYVPWMAETEEIITTIIRDAHHQSHARPVTFNFNVVPFRPRTVTPAKNMPVPQTVAA